MTKEIQLANGKGIALVDDDDYPVLSRFDWCLHSGGYATTTIDRHKIYMHRFVMRVCAGHVADHINGNKLDNRKQNLRQAHWRENACNQKHRDIAGKLSRYRGVTIYKKAGWSSWTAAIKVNYKRIHLGYFRDEIDAARAYDKAARKHHGEFAKLNFPQE